jgi:ABC-2 type transport system ATP-binding protein
MRGDLAAALRHDPPVPYLDEPTVGLDVLAKEAVRGFVEEANRSGRTTVRTRTHSYAWTAAASLSGTARLDARRFPRGAGK